MKRVVIVGALLVIGLGTLIALKIRAQTQALLAPSGGSGTVEGIEVDVSSLVSSRITAVHVRAGEHVEQGALLVELDCEEPEQQLAEAEARVAMAEAQLATAEASAQGARRQTLVVRAQAQVATAQADAIAVQEAAAERDVDRLARTPSATPEAQLDRGRSQAEALAAQRAATLRSGRATLAQAQVTAAQADAALGQVQSARHAVEASRTAVTRARRQVSECRVVAPRAALVDDVFYEVGEIVARGAPLVRLVDLTEVTATFYLPNAELAAGRTGAEATVVADAYPGQTWRGRVSTVSVEAAFTPRNIQTRTDRDRLVYPIEVRLTNADGRLRPGMPVQVTLLGTERAHP